MGLLPFLSFEQKACCLHTCRLTWNIIMEVWKIIFRSKWVISRFQPLIFQGVVPGIYLDSPWPVRVPKKSPFCLIRTFYSPPFSAGPNICICTCICTCTCICICICTCTCTCMCMCMHVCIYIYIHIYPSSFHHCFIPPKSRGKNKNSHKQRLHESLSHRSSASNFSSAWTSWKTWNTPPEQRLQRRCLDFLKKYEINGMGFTISMTWYVFSIR